MRDKIKKAVISFTYRSIICLCIFAAALTVKRFFPNVWENVENVYKKSIDVSSASEYLKHLLYEITPKIKR